MPNLTVINVSENQTTTVASGEEVSINIRAGGKRFINIFLNVVSPTYSTGTATWTFAADDTILVGDYDHWPSRVHLEGHEGDDEEDYGYQPGCQWSLIPGGNQSGVFHVTFSCLTINGGLYFVRLKVTVEGTMAGGLSGDWLSPHLIDLRFDLRDRSIVSNYLTGAKAIKIGDTLPLAVLPVLGGEAVASDITALSLSVRAPDTFADDDFLFLTAAAVTLVEADDEHNYYSLPVTLDSFALRDWFDAQNSKNPAPATDQLRTVSAMAELRLTHNSRVVTSETFTLPIQQPVNALA